VTELQKLRSYTCVLCTAEGTGANIPTRRRWDLAQLGRWMKGGETLQDTPGMMWEIQKGHPHRDCGDGMMVDGMLLDDVLTEIWPGVRA
jgi:hypothetical protein